MRTPFARPLLIAAVVLLLAPLPAAGSSGDVIRDCSEDGTLDRSYSQKELAGALDNLPSDLDEYTDCRTVIRRAQLAGAKGKRKDEQGGVLSRVDQSTPVKPHESRSIERAAGSAERVHIAGKRIRPGAAGAPFAAAGLGTDLPAYVLTALVGLGAAMISGALFAVRRRWPEAWQTASAAIGAPIRRIGDGLRRGISRFRR
jgi:hypothetical protein